LRSINHKNKRDPSDVREGDDLIAGTLRFGHTLNRKVRAFAETLDDVEFIAWWRCNPDRKP